MPALRATVLFRLDPRFPFDDVEAIGARLMACGALTPGFVPPAAGLLTVQAMLYADRIERRPTALLPDRNVVTRMARIARDGSVGREDKPTRLALDLMAFCQAMNINIEPGLAFHELAQVMGDEVAKAMESAARALCRLEGNPENTRFEGKPMWQSYLPAAKAAIEAALPHLQGD